MKRARQAAAIGLVAMAWATSASGQLETRPSTEYSSAYAPPSAAGEPGVNEGGVRFDLVGRYMTDNLFRGIDYSEVGTGPEDSGNIQIDGRMVFDLGKAPHPFIGVFANIYDEDPISQFQAIIPQIGVEWTLRPFRLTLANNAYLYPDREDLETAEVALTTELDDSYFLKTDEPVFRPYLLVAWDYDRNKGWYLEAGIRHRRDLGDGGLSATFQADVAYTFDFPLYAVTPGGNGTGFQHYDLGLILSYDLNHALRSSNRWGIWSLEGYVWYTDGIDNDLLATTQIWGGIGLRFHY